MRMTLYYPIQDYGPLMKGMVIGGLGILHVFLAQMALGGGMLLCYFEWLRRTGRSRNAGRECRLGSLATSGTTTLMGTMLGHDRRTWLGQVEDLPRCVSARHGGRQCHPAFRAGRRIVVHDDIGVLGLT